MESRNQADIKLKWHRFLQVIGMPLSILALAYQLISMISDLFGFDFSWTDGWLRTVLQLLGTDAFHLGSYFWPVVAVLAAVIIQLVLILYAWTGSFRWNTYSRRCWIAYLVLNSILCFFSIYLFWEYMLNRGGLIMAAPMLSRYLGRPITISTSLITACKVILVVLAALQLFYVIANIIYYRKRKQLYHTDDGVQQPYIPQSEKPVESTPVQETLQLQPEEKEEIEEPLPGEELPEEKSVLSLDEMLKDTEESITRMALNPTPAEETEPAENMEEDQDITENIPLQEESIDDTSEQESPSMPEEQEEKEEAVPCEGLSEETEEQSLDVIAEEEEESSPDIKEEPEKEEEEEKITPLILPHGDPEDEIDATEIIHLPEGEEDILHFCPECGTKIPDPQMCYCIRCGKKIR